jgi:hypothetical protein
MLANAIFDVDPFGRRATPGTGTAFLVLAAFVISFLLIRTSARLTRSVSWWPGGVQTESGLHVHHLVWGICLMMLSGFVGFGLPLGTPWWNLAAIAFGVGAGFTMGRILLGVVGLFIPLAGVFGAVRLGHPTSPWGRRRYTGERLERAQSRFGADARAVRWQRRVSDLVAGAPSPSDDH